MESIAGYDAYKTASPEEYVDEKEIKILERNLKDCPFCLGRPYFEDCAHVANRFAIFVSCHCGAQIRGDDWHDVAAKWNTRPAPVARKILREGPRAYWPGA